MVTGAETIGGLAQPFAGEVAGLVAASGGRVSITSGRRTYAEQAQLRVRNGCPDIYTSPASSCRVPTAIPGTSKHEKGLAVDFGGDLSLVARLAPQFGLIRTVAGEAWHYEDDPATGPNPDAGTGGIAKTIGGTVAGFGGDLAGDVIDPLIAQLRKVLVVAVLVAGGAALVGSGALRATTGHTATNAAGHAAKAGAAVATGGESLAVTGV